MQAVIISGGLGTRLHPLTLEVPKPMLPIGGMPHLEYQIRLLRKHGIKDIIFSTGYLHEKIEEYFGDGSKFGVKIQYKEDGNKPLGTAGAVRNCEELIISDDVLIFNGDILTDLNLGRMAEYHKFQKQPITMSLYGVEDPSQFGVAVLDKRGTGKIVDFIEKPTSLNYGNLINAGVYIVAREVLCSIEPDRYSMFEKDIFPKFANSHMLQGFIYHEMKWLDIGTFERYGHAQLLCQKIIL